MAEFVDYDDGYRHGVFDKCNGRPCFVADAGVRDPDNLIWDDGYLDGWNTNDRQIPEEDIVPTNPTFDTEFMWRVFCELDYGQDGLIFADQPTAKAWIYKAVNEDEYLEDTAEEMEAQGLISIDSVEVIR